MLWLIFYFHGLDQDKTTQWSALDLPEIKIGGLVETYTQLVKARTLRTRIFVDSIDLMTYHVIQPSVCSLRKLLPDPQHFLSTITLGKEIFIECEGRVHFSSKFSQTSLSSNQITYFSLRMPGNTLASLVISWICQ